MNRARVLAGVWAGWTLLGGGVGAVELKAGVAKAVISDAAPRVMVNGRVSQGVAHDIYARALTLNDGERRLVIITYDLNCLDVATPILRRRAQETYGLDPARLILLATHNHNAPIQIVPENFDYGRRLADRLLALIGEAIAAERGPVRLLFGFGHGYFIFSRGNAPTDYEIQMLKVMEGERPLALLFNHGTHPAQGSFARIEPGHPGYAMDAIEARLSGTQAMYADACGGNQYAARPSDYEARLAAARERGPEAVDAVMEEVARGLGRELAEAALQIAGGAFVEVTGPLAASMEILSLPLREPISKEEALKLAEKFPPEVGFVPYPHPHRGTNWVRMLLRYYDRGLPFPTRTTEMICTDDTYLIHRQDQEFLAKYDGSIDDHFPSVYNEVIVARIGPMPLVAIQGEVCAPIGARVKDAFRRERPIMVFGYMGEHNLYLPTRELVRLNAYQAQVIQIQYASPVGWSPEVEDVVVEAVTRLTERVLADEGQN